MPAVLLKRGLAAASSLFAVMVFCAATPAMTQPAAAGAAPTPVRTNGLVADLYLPPQAKESLPAVIVLGGSEGGMGAGAAKEARLIADQGCAVLQVAYFGAPGLPPSLGLIPVEYFEKAVDWLSGQPAIDRRRIGIVGTSVGGEAALLIAAHDPRIKVVVAGVPSSVVWPGISRTDPRPPSTFTLGGQPLPDLPYGWTGAFVSIYDLYERGLTTLSEHPDAVIPVERIDGPVMLVCGKADSLWPSCPMSEQIVARLKARGFHHPVELLAYADAGHAVFGPPADPGSPNFANLGSLGGSATGNQAARQDDWPRAMAFLDAALKP